MPLDENGLKRLRDDTEYFSMLLQGQTPLKWYEVFVLFTDACERYRIAFEFEYKNGWFTNPETEESYFDEDRCGYAMFVGGRCFMDEDGTSATYDKVSYAIYDGVRILKQSLEELLEEQDDPDNL